MIENKVLATVNDKEITQNDVDLLKESLGQQRAQQFNSEEGQKRLLDELINRELFYLDAVNNGLDQQEDFKRELEEAKKHILTQFAISNLLHDVKVDEEEALKYYNENKEQFKKPESVRASHILLVDEKEADQVLKEVQAGLSFEDAEKKYSKCSGDSEGGDLGYFSRGKMVPEFENAVFTMEIGEITSNLIKTQFGYHIIKLVDKKEPEPSSFEEVKSQLVQQMSSMKRNRAYSDKADKLKKVYQVNVK